MMSVEGVVTVEQTVVNPKDRVQLWRETSKRLDEAGVTVNLKVKIAHDAVVGHLVLLKRLEFPLDLLQRMAEVEGELLLLRVKFEREFVALLHDIDHLQVLLLIILGESGSCFRYLLVIALHASPEIVQREAEAFFGGLGEQREYE